MKTTLHNHVKIGTEEKPLIPNVIFKSLLILVEHKDYDAADYILKCYSLVPDQIKIYEYLKQKTA